jgi:hypothetical protein
LSRLHTGYQIYHVSRPGFKPRCCSETPASCTRNSCEPNLSDLYCTSQITCGFCYKCQICAAEGNNFCLLFNQRSIFIYYYELVQKVYVCSHYQGTRSDSITVIKNVGKITILITTINILQPTLSFIADCFQLKYTYSWCDLKID